MKKKSVFMVALASALLAASCSTDDENTKVASYKAPISLNPTFVKTTRAVETTTANLQEFQTYSFQDGQANYMDGITYKLGGGTWSTDAGTFYWPTTGDLHFYCYAPATPGSEGAFTINSTAQTLTGFVPYTTAATQQDFIYAQATGNLAGNGTSGLDINFNHALSEISVAAKNSNTAYKVEVSGVKVGNVISKGDFTFPTTAGVGASWALGTDKATYTTEWDAAKTLDGDASSLNEANVPFMLIPQQLASNEQASAGNYIALKIKITMQGGTVIYDGWSYVAVPTLWEMGKHYHYTVDYTNGGGQKENGDPIISGTEIKLNVTVTDWVSVENKIEAKK